MKRKTAKPTGRKYASVDALMEGERVAPQVIRHYHKLRLRDNAYSEARFMRNTLEQIARQKRRTLEVRMAASALSFWDALQVEARRRRKITLTLPAARSPIRRRGSS